MCKEFIPSLPDYGENCNRSGAPVQKYGLATSRLCMNVVISANEDFCIRELSLGGVNFEGVNEPQL